MKKNVLFIFLFACVFFSCDNVTVPDEIHSTDIASIRETALNLSQTHDSLVLAMLVEEKKSIAQKANSVEPAHNALNREKTLEIIHDVIGIRPVIVSDQEKPYKINQSATNTEGFPVINFDTDQISLATYASSTFSSDYLKKVDAILADNTLCIEEKIEAITVIQETACSDEKASLSDIESIMFGTEILKGSLQLWSNEPDFQISPSPMEGRFAVNALSKWSVWRKLGFVAAADAIGGVLGFWFGGYITVQGVTMWFPPGPGGVAASAAGLSFIAARMVGW